MNLKISKKARSNITKGALIAALPFIGATSCRRAPTGNADATAIAQKLAQLDQETNILWQEIDSIRGSYEKMIDDSVANSRRMIMTAKQLETMTPHIDKMADKNTCIEDSIYRQDMKNIAKKYPLKHFLNAEQLKVIQMMLADYHQEWNNEPANNIIKNRGTLADLYAISYDLEYGDYEMPFYIINDQGYVRFVNEELNKKCESYERECAAAQDSTHVKDRQQRAMRINGYKENIANIEKYDSICENSDELYENIAEYFWCDYRRKYSDKEAYLEELITTRNRLTR